MNKSESIKELATALCKFHGEVSKIKKTETNPFFKNKYADLSSILDAIDPHLTANGLIVTQHPIGENELETMILHTSGEFMSSTYQMKPVKDDPQGLGSTITYQRRYALGAVLGLNIDIDDDGNTGSNNKSEAVKRPTTPAQLPVQTIPQLLEEASEKVRSAKTTAELNSTYKFYPELEKNSVFINLLKERKNKLSQKQTA